MPCIFRGKSFFLSVLLGEPPECKSFTKKIERRENSFEHSKVSFFSSYHIIIIALLFLLHISGNDHINNTIMVRGYNVTDGADQKQDHHCIGEKRLIYINKMRP